MDIWPDWLGQTGGAGTPYPVLVQGLDLTVEVVSMDLVVQDLDVNLVVGQDRPVITVQSSDTVQVVATPADLELEVQGA